MSYPNTVVPRLSFRLQRLDPESMTHCSTAQTVAALYLVCYDPHLHPDNENTSQDTWHFLQIKPYWACEINIMGAESY